MGAAASSKKRGGAAAVAPPAAPHKASFKSEGLPNVPADFAKEMASVVALSASRGCDHEDDDEEEQGTNVTDVSSERDASWRESRRIRQFSSEFLVDTSLLSQLPGVANASATVHELTKAKLLAYYARRDGTMAGGQRARAISDADLSGANASAATSEVLQYRAGALRAARTQRVYSEPPSSCNTPESHSFNSFTEVEKRNPNDKAFDGGQPGGSPLGGRRAMSLIDGPAPAGAPAGVPRLRAKAESGREGGAHSPIAEATGLPGTTENIDS